MLMAPLERLGSKLTFFGSRFFGLIILPAQLPGDPIDMAMDLKDDPIGTIKSWKWETVKQIWRQIRNGEKITIPDDPLLSRLLAPRNKYRSQKSWTECPIKTADGLTLDGFIKAPTNRDIPPRYIVFVGGNSQRYEDWLPYFDLYARESGLGFLCFNNRGVARSEGAVCCLEDMLTDLHAVVDHLTESLGVQEEHVLIHGFSIGGSIASLFLAQPHAPRCAITSDRSFRSFCHAAFAICRGGAECVGDAPPVVRARRGSGSEEGCKARLAELGLRLLRGLLGIARAVLAQIAVLSFRSTGWELNALEAWRRIETKKVLVYNRADNIVHYEGASLHHGLVTHKAIAGADAASPRLLPTEARDGYVRTPCNRTSQEALADTAVIEVTLRDADGWALHDCPLSLDADAWHAMIRAERAALGLDVRGDVVL